MKTLKKDKNGAMGTWAIVTFVVVIGLLLAYFGGFLAFSLPSVDDDYSQTVIRGVTDVGIKVPVEVKLNFNQVADAGTKKAQMDVSVRHKHDTKTSSDSNYVPDPTVISKLEYDTEVGNVGDTTTIYAVNHNSFTASDIAFNSTVLSSAGVNFGYAQLNYKVWTEDTVPPPTPSTSTGSHVIVIQSVFEHYRKLTNVLLNSDVVTFGIYYTMPAFNADDSYTETYNFFIFVPFDDYAVVEDIKWEVKSYHDSCIIQWKTITGMVRTEYSWELFGITVFKIVKYVHSTISTNIEYHWQNPKAYNFDNSNTYGSHRYTYKIR